MNQLAILLLFILSSTICLESYGLCCQSNSVPTQWQVNEKIADGKVSGQPSVIFLNGVPVTSKIYDPVVAELMQSGRTGKLIQVDLPQTGASTFSGQKTSWSSQRAVLRKYLSSKSNYILVVHDISGPIALPLVPELKGLRGVVVLNTIIEASKFKPPFPMNVYRRPIVGRLLLAATRSGSFERTMRKQAIDRNECVSSELLQQIYRDSMSNGGRKRLHQVMMGFELDVRTDQLIQTALHYPVDYHVIWGLSDEGLGQEFYKLPQNLQDSALVIPSAKHFFMMDYPRELASSILAKYF